MIKRKHIKEIENLLNKGKIIQYELLQVSFEIACIKIKLEDNNKYIVKYDVKSQRGFNAIESESKNLQYLNKIFNFFSLQSFCDKGINFFYIYISIFL